MHYWEDFRHKLDSNYWQVKKIFWQIFGRLHGKNFELLDAVIYAVSCHDYLEVLLVAFD